MKSYTSNVGRKLRSELKGIVDYPFAQRCGTALQTVFPLLTEVPARSKLDHGGIDHCLYAENTDDLLLAVQCKGFSGQELEASQLRQCLHSIRSFTRSRFKADRYLFVINRIVKGERRTRIENELAKLVRLGKAATAELLDCEAFIELIFKKAQEQLMELCHACSARFQEQHRQRMDEGVYVENVPFRIDDRGRENPLRFLEEWILKLVNGPTNKRGWAFLSGEFGFGKTSLLLRIAEILHNRGIPVLYLPAAQFHSHAFDGEMEFMWEALQIVLHDEAVDRTNEHHKILHAALKEIFKREKRVVLILDGIDEHPTCWSENGLRSLFGIFKSFNGTCLFALREEFLAERTGDFHAAIKGCPGASMLRLSEWPESLILQFTEHYRNTAPTSDARGRIAHFEKAVRDGRYIAYYGDIPKRPLFLKMLLDDVAKEDLRRRNLAELYDRYIGEKIDFDRATSTSNPVVSRPLSSNEDREILCSRLFEVMTLAAGRMYTLQGNELRLEPRLDEDLLITCSRQVAGEFLDLKSILLNSVMVPTGRRSRHVRGGRIEVAFAHTSFQEFFLARYILNALRDKNDDTGILRAVIPEPVRRFLQGLVSALPRDEQTAIHSRCRDLIGNTLLLTAPGGEPKS